MPKGKQREVESDYDPLLMLTGLMKDIKVSLDNNNKLLSDTVRGLTAQNADMKSHLVDIQNELKQPEIKNDHTCELNVTPVALFSFVERIRREFYKI